VAVDIPPATPPTITTFFGDSVVSGLPAIIISSRPHLRENQGLRSVVLSSGAFSVLHWQRSAGGT
jgi:hypothetical protein